MRIRTIKPEFWQHETLAGLPEFARLLALALLNYADDEGYFLASGHLIRGNLFPFEDDSTKILRSLAQLSEVGWIRIGKDAQNRQVGCVVNFAKHQRIDRAQPSKIKGSTTFVEDSTNDRQTVAEESLLEWIRDQGSGKGIPPNPQGGKKGGVSPASSPAIVTEPVTPPAEIPAKKKKGAAAVEELTIPAHWPEAKRLALREWEAYKREQFGQRYKPLGWAKLVSSLERRSAEELQAAVDLAMSKTWKGLVWGDESARPQTGFSPEKKEGGAAAVKVVANVCPAGFEAACEALYGRVPGPWATLGDGEQAEIRSWIAAPKKEGGAR